MRPQCGYKVNGYLVAIIVFTPLHLPDILAATSYYSHLNLEIGKLRCLSSDKIKMLYIPKL